ncbi:MAG: hypothetical protein IT378_06380, partial [Sandaracinaceae bacterium]|nr:hypothetical protein [Sandaracinaceae bacterium]
GGSGRGPPAGGEVRGESAADTTWDCPLYVLQGNVFVVNNSTLTIAAGTEILGETGGSDAAALIIARGSRLEAVGTAAEPIVFTSGNPDGARTSGDWAGVVLLGSATTNDGACEGDGNPATPECDAPGFLQDRIEGIDVADPRGVYGGTDDASDCGTLRYVRIEFAGRELSPDNELNGLTVGGCGSGTELGYVQVHRGKDDGIELFGGTASMDHVVITGAQDDSLDFDEGWRGNVQFLVIHQYAGFGDRGIEADNLGANEDASPRTDPTLFNVTMLGTTSTSGMLLREGMRGTLRNLLLSSFGAPIDVHARLVDPNAEWPAELSIENSFFYMAGAFQTEDLTDRDAIWTAARAESWGGALPATRPATSSGATDFDMITDVALRSMYRSYEDDHYDDDMGFDESAELMDAARNNTFGTDPMVGSASETDPDYVPANAALNGQATPTFGDTTATYAGALEPGTTAPWTADWTAFPVN